MPSLLIVDDDETVLNVLAELFSPDYLCHTAGAAEAALAQLAARDYDVVVTDISMPGLSGEDLLGFVKAYSPRTPVLFISGSIDDERAERLRTKGAFDYLAKPFRLEEVAERVARAMAQGRRLQPE